jgi:hypothetical protein
MTGAFCGAIIMHVVALVCVCCDFPSPIAATVEGLIYILLTRLRCCCKAAFHHMPRMVWCKGLIKGGEWRRICSAEVLPFARPDLSIHGHLY